MRTLLDQLQHGLIITDGHRFEVDDVVDSIRAGRSRTHEPEVTDHDVVGVNDGIEVVGSEVVGVDDGTEVVGSEVVGVNDGDKVVGSEVVELSSRSPQADRASAATAATAAIRAVFFTAFLLMGCRRPLSPGRTPGHPRAA